MRRMRKALGVVLLVAACGDPRTVFVGSYAGSGMRTYSGSTNTVALNDLVITISAPAKSDRLDFTGACGFTATPDGSDSFAFDPASCPTQHSTAFSGATADFTDTYGGGSGTLTGDSLVLAMYGTDTGTNYSDGSPTYSVGFTQKITVRR